LAGIFSKTGRVFGGIFLALLLALPVSAQLKIGEVSSNMNGIISAGYNGDYGNQINSDHSLTFGGSGTLNGYYYNPNFLSFTVSPYANQSRDNSSYQSISNASGLNVSSNIFGGSHFPGSINYAKAYNSEGNFAVPGVANYTTHGDSQTIGIQWSELVPGLPTLSASYQRGSSQYSIYGTDSNGNSDFSSFNLHSSYMLAGFNLGAYFNDGSSHSDLPQVVEGSSGVETSNSSTHGFGFTATHKLPLHGAFSSDFDRTTVDSNFIDYSYNGTIDTYTGTAAFQPTQKSHFSVSTNYSDNLTGSLYQAITSTGGIAIPPQQGSESSNAFDLAGNASYSIRPNLQGLVSADYRQQSFLGKSYSSESYGGGVTYWHMLFGGNFNSAVSLSDNRVSTSSANELGFSGSMNYSKRFDGWRASGSFNYSQNVQTLLITYMSSMYSYSGNISRRFREFGWSAGAEISKTGLTAQNGITSGSQSYNSAINYGKWFNLNGTYSKSTGSGIESGAGIVILPTPEPVPSTNDLILFGGKSWGFGFSSTPMRRLILSASFAKAETNSSFTGVLSNSNTKQINTLFQYQFRKMYLTGGYSNLVQGFSASGTPPENVSTFYIGVSRWFNFF
jgi:hypothetical protein